MSTPRVETEDIKNALSLDLDFLEKVHAVVDIETLSTENNAAVYAIGVVIFPASASPSDIIEDLSAKVVCETEMGGLFDVFPSKIPKFRILLNPLLQSKFASIEQQGLKFTLQTNKEEYLASLCTSWETSKALATLSEILKGYKVVTVWANDPSFDMVILKSLEKATNSENSIPYLKEASLRTARLLLAGLGQKKRTSAQDLGLSGAHNSVNDCIIQAYDILRLLSLFKDRK